MKKGLFLFSAVLILAMFFSACGVGVSVKIPTFSFRMTINPFDSPAREPVTGEETAEYVWEKVDTKGFNVRELYLKPELEIYPDSTETLDQGFDFELYLSEKETTQAQHLFLEDSITPATKTYSWDLTSENSDGVARLLDLIKKHKSTTLVFTLKYSFEELTPDMKPVPVKFDIKGNANVGF